MRRDCPARVGSSAVVGLLLLTAAYLFLRRRRQRLAPGPIASRPQEIAPGVHWLGTGNGITEANVYFVRSGSSWVVIDTAWPNRARLIEETAASLFGANTRPAALLLTHIHPDHAGAARELARLWDVPVYVHSEELPMAAGDLSTFEQYGGPLDLWVILPLLRAIPRRRRESMLAASSLKEVARAFDPRAGIPGLPDWECVHTPGHTPGHVSFFRTSDRVLITGDAVVHVQLNSIWGLLLGKQGLSLPPWYTTWNWQTSMESVAALAQLEPRVLACGHGSPLTGAGTARALRAFADHAAAPHLRGTRRSTHGSQGRAVTFGDAL